MTTRWRWSPRRKCAPAACPTRRAVSAVIGSMLVVPRIPSVPKNLRVIAAVLARFTDPAPDSCRDRMCPCRNQVQQRPADEGDGSRISETPTEGNKGGLRGPLVPALSHQHGFLVVLPGRTGECENDDRTVEHQALGLAKDHQVHG